MIILFLSIQSKKKEVIAFLNELKSILEKEDFDIDTEVILIRKGKKESDQKYSTPYTLLDLDYEIEDVVERLNATVELATIRCLIRDHDLERYYERKQCVERGIDFLNEKYGSGTASLTWVNQYFSMFEVIKTVPFMIPFARQAMLDCGVEPYQIAMRGGTDGSWLSQMGLPCPNITAGYENAHGHFECVSIDAMAKNVEILIRLCEIYAENAES